QLKKTIWDAVEHLSAPQRATVMLFYRESMNCQEIGEILNMPAATVKSHLHRARARLKDSLSETMESDWTQVRFGEVYVEPRLSTDFTERLMASLPSHRMASSLNQHRWMRAKRWGEIAGIPAIAACVAFMIMFSGNKPTGSTVSEASQLLSTGPQLVAGDS